MFGIYRPSGGRTTKYYVGVYGMEQRSFSELVYLFYHQHVSRVTNTHHPSTEKDC